MACAISIPETRTSVDHEHHPAPEATVSRDGLDSPTQLTVEPKPVDTSVPCVDDTVQPPSAPVGPMDNAPTVLSPTIQTHLKSPPSNTLEIPLEEFEKILLELNCDNLTHPDYMLDDFSTCACEGEMKQAVADFVSRITQINQHHHH